MPKKSKPSSNGKAMLKLQLLASTYKELLRWAQIPVASWYAFCVAKTGDTEGKAAYKKRMAQIKKVLK